MRWWVYLGCLALAAGCGTSTNQAPEVADEAATGAREPLLPGVAIGDPALQAELDAALAARGPDYVPRTHHKTPDGSPKYTNRLILETSPYLLQHAHNPVNFYPWGDEAFARAVAEDKPILLSVGYSTCHWCHVMERESFEDEEIAAFMNAHFIPVKVDREERPDVDDIYMTAVRMLTGKGGWPMTVALTPQGEPFFAGTYFPARTGDRGARKGFLTILGELSESYATDREGVVARAQELSQRIRDSARPARPGQVPGPEALHAAAVKLAGTYDSVWGGFGGGKKFPRPATLELLLRYHRRTGDDAALQIATHTLQKMAAGGMHDQIGGGFHRYSVDRKWLVPHFEKMLYDNAQLAAVYTEAWQLTGRADFARVARLTLDYVAREMTDPSGGLHSATDADSPGPDGHDEEGLFFTWTPDEITAVLGPDRARYAMAWFAVTDRGDLDGRNILNTPRPAGDVAAELGMSPAALQGEIDAAAAALYRARLDRPPPIRDDKIITAWNGLMISAFARGALAFDEPRYLERAREAAAFVLRHMRTDDGRLLRTYKDGRARHAATLEDYAFLTAGLIDLYEAGGEPRWLEAAIGLQAAIDLHYRDEAGGYFMTAADGEALLARTKPDYDGAEPSGNSVAALNLLRLEELTGRHAYRQAAESVFAAFSMKLGRTGQLPKMLAALDYYLDTPLEILLVAPGGDADALMAPVRAAFLPNRIFALVSDDGVAAHTALVPLLEGKSALGGAATAYVCEKGLCERPTSDPRELERQISQIVPLFEEDAPAALSIPEAIAPWTYDAAKDQHWNPAHGHWHAGKPPAGAKGP